MMELLDKKGMNEAEFLEYYSTRNYPKPALTADIILFGDNRSRILLIRRGGHPFIGHWALPGGFASADETIEDTAARELEEETGISGIQPRLSGVFSKPGRDPRGWVVSAAFSADVMVSECRARAGDDAASAEWFCISREGKRITLSGTETQIIFDFEISGNEIMVNYVSQQMLAFDHAQMIAGALSED